MKHASCISCVVGALMSDDDSGLKSDLFMLEQGVGRDVNDSTLGGRWNGVTGCTWSSVSSDVWSGVSVAVHGKMSVAVSVALLVTVPVEVRGAVSVAVFGRMSMAGILLMTLTSKYRRRVADEILKS